MGRPTADIKGGPPTKMRGVWGGGRGGAPPEHDHFFSICFSPISFSPISLSLKFDSLVSSDGECVYGAFGIHEPSLGIPWKWSKTGSRGAHRACGFRFWAIDSPFGPIDSPFGPIDSLFGRVVLIGGADPRATQPENPTLAHLG